MTSSDSSEGAGREGWVMEVDECLEVLTASSSIFEKFAKMGVKVDGDPGEKLRQVYKTMEGLKTRCLTGEEDNAALKERVKLLEEDCKVKDGAMEQMKKDHSLEREEGMNHVKLLENQCQAKDEGLEQMMKNYNLEKERRTLAESDLKKMKAEVEVRNSLTTDQQPKVTPGVVEVAVQTELLSISTELESSNQRQETRPDPCPQGGLVDTEVPPQAADLPADILDSQGGGAAENLEGDSLAGPGVEDMDESSGLPIQQPNPESAGSTAQPRTPAPVNCSGSGQEVPVNLKMETLQESCDTSIRPTTSTAPTTAPESLKELRRASSSPVSRVENNVLDGSAVEEDRAQPPADQNDAGAERSSGVDSTPEVNQGGEHRNHSPVADPSDDMELGGDRRNAIRIVNSNDPTVFDVHDSQVGDREENIPKGGDVSDRDRPVTSAPAEPASASESANVPQLRRSKRRDVPCAKLSAGEPGSTPSVSHPKSRRTSSPGQQPQTHNPSRRYFVCSICFKVFYTLDKLALHKKVHRPQENSFKCHHCTSRFKLSQELIAHQQRCHSGRKPFQCLFCKKRFKRWSDLEDHTRVHTEERPHFCNVCYEEFTKECNLNRHLRRMHQGEMKKIHSCSFCGKRFADQGDCRRHEKTHYDEREAH